MDMMNNPSFAAPVIFGLVWLGFMVIMLGAWILFLIAIWRGMKAHESIAESLKTVAEHLKLTSVR